MSASPRTAGGKSSGRWSGVGWMVFFGLLGLLFAYYSWSQFSEHRRLATGGQLAKAIVADYEEVRGRRSTTYYPIFSFTTADGRQIEATSGASADPSELWRGTTIAVIYNPADPSEVQQQEAVEGGPGFTPWFLAFLALVMFALGSIFLLPSRSQPPG